MILGPVGFERILGVSQIFLNGDQANKIVLLIARVIGYIFIPGDISDIGKFALQIKSRFCMTKVIIDGMSFNVCKMYQDSVGNIRITMANYISKTKPLKLQQQQKQCGSACTLAKEITLYPRSGWGICLLRICCSTAGGIHLVIHAATNP